MTYILVLMVFANVEAPAQDLRPPSMLAIPGVYSSKEECVSAGKVFLTDVRVYQCIPAPQATRSSHKG
jgi:hypothetical protein